MEVGLKLNWRMGTVSKLDMTRKTSRSGGWTATEVMIVVVLLILLAVVVIRVRPNKRLLAHPGIAEVCISNLRSLDGAKRQWALELHKASTDIPTAGDIQPYLGGGPSADLPLCPFDSQQTFDTSYSLNNVGTKPTCKIMPTEHILP
jgi:hypothetical protein